MGRNSEGNHSLKRRVALSLFLVKASFPKKGWIGGFHSIGLGHLLFLRINIGVIFNYHLARFPWPKHQEEVYPIPGNSLRIGKSFFQEKGIFSIGGKERDFYPRECFPFSRTFCHLAFQNFKTQGEKKNFPRG